MSMNIINKENYLPRTKDFDPLVFQKTVFVKFGLARLEYIAGGAYGAVYAGYKRAKTGGTAKYAVKVITSPYSDPEYLRRWAAKTKTEVDLLEKVKDHKNLVKLHSHFWLRANPTDLEPSYLLLKLELLALDLDELLIGIQGPMPPEHVRRIALEIGSFLEHLHNLKISHHDIKPSNIMLGGISGKKSPKNLLDSLSICDVRVIDLGMAVEYQTGPGSTIETSFWGGTRHYNSPEKQAKRQYDPYLADCYAFGLTLMEMLMGTSLLKNKMGWHRRDIFANLVNQNQNPVNLNQDNRTNQASKVWEEFLQGKPFDPLNEAIQMLVAPEPDRIPITAALAFMRMRN